MGSADSHARGPEAAARMFETHEVPRSASTPGREGVRQNAVRKRTEGRLAATDGEAFAEPAVVPQRGQAVHERPGLQPSGGVVGGVDGAGRCRDEHGSRSITRLGEGRVRTGVHAGYPCEHQPEVLGVGHREVEVALADGNQRLIGSLVEPRLHCLGEQDVTVGAQFEKEVLPIGEMVAGGRVRDVEAARQAPERDGIDSFLLEQEARLGKQRRSQVAVMVGACLLSTAGLHRRACGAPRSHGPILTKQS